MLYDYILIKFEFECFRAKVKVTMAIFGKRKHHSSPYIYGQIFILFQTNAKYYNMLDKFEYEHSWAKVKVTVAIFF